MAKGVPNNGVNAGWFKAGGVGPFKGKKRPEITGSKHWRFRGPKPKCWCGKQLSRWDARNCQLHAFDETRREAIRAGRRKAVGEKHPNWKGSGASYRALHLWLRRSLGAPSLCETCKATNKTKRIEWANVSGKYKRELSDWMALCKMCHVAHDAGLRGEKGIKSLIKEAYGLRE